MCLKRKEDIEDAIEQFKQAITIRPDYQNAYTHCALLLKKKGNNQEAIKMLEQAKNINPNDAFVQRELGCLYRDHNQFDKAIQALQTALSLEPKKLVYILELANTLAMNDDYEQAKNLYTKALEINPETTSALHNIAYILKRQGLVAESLEILNSVIKRKPEDPLAHFSLALTHLTLGNFDQGWPEYEWRWDAYGQTKAKIGDAPYWSGENISNKTILLVCEQGLGDTFQFIRYAELLKQEGAQVIVVAQAAVQQILKTGCPYIDKVLLAGDPIPTCDYQVALMSLPLLFNTTAQTVPANIPYMKPDESLVEIWKQRLNDDKNFKVGLCWQGNSQYRNQFLQLTVAAKSIPVECFEQLATVADCSFYSLQKINGTDQIIHIGDNFKIYDFGKELDEEHGRFMDTAALIKNMDLIITIDTSIGHLAAAMGKPTWIILPTPADWRWMLNRSDTPWYPNIRLFRQPKQGDWQGALELVRQALTDYIKNKSMTTIQQNEQAQSPEDFFDALTIQAIRAHISIDPDELAIIMRHQQKAQQAYDSYIQTNPMLKDLVQCLLDCNKLIGDIETKIQNKHLSILSEEYTKLIEKLPWILAFKKHIKHEINLLTNSKESND